MRGVTNHGSGHLGGQTTACKGYCKQRGVTKSLLLLDFFNYNEVRHENQTNWREQTWHIRDEYRHF